MLDHLFFSVIYAIPNLSFTSKIPGFGSNSEKFEKVMQIKLEMQKRVSSFYLIY